MSLANDALNEALEEYDREDLRTQVARRVPAAIFEMHNVALFPRDLVVSSLQATSASPQDITIPGKYRMLEQVLAYTADGTLMDCQFKKATVKNPTNYQGFAEGRSYMISGNTVTVTYNDIAPAFLALQYYAYPTVTVTDSVPTTDSWIVATNYQILAAKLKAIVAKLSGNKDDVKGHEMTALNALEALYGE